MRFRIVRAAIGAFALCGVACESLANLRGAHGAAGDAGDADAGVEAATTDDAGAGAPDAADAPDASDAAKGPATPTKFVVSQNVSLLLADTTNLYFVNALYPYKAALADGTPVQMGADLAMLVGWWQDAGYLYLFDGPEAGQGQIRRLPKSTPPGMAEALTPSGEFVTRIAGAVGLGIDASYLYYTRTAGTQAPQLVRTPKTPTLTPPALIATTSMTETVAALDTPDNATTEATTVYLIDRVPGTLTAVAVANGERTPVAAMQDGVRDLVVTSDAMYWANETAGQVMKLPNGGTPQQLVGGQDGPGSVVVDGATIYWTTPTSVLSCPIADCAAHVTTLATDQGEPTGLHVTAAAFYWTASQQIWRLAR
jgi:hypothetical protein